VLGRAQYSVLDIVYEDVDINKWEFEKDI